MAQALLGGRWGSELPRMDQGPGLWQTAVMDFLRALRTDGTALAEAARLGLDPPVPACPG
jgi:hypothetical protein